MDRSTRTGMKWELTVIRNGKQGVTEKIAHAEFRFGRKSTELDDSPIMRLPSGLMAALGEAGLTEEALESGFLVDIRSGESEDEGWRNFTTVVIMEPSCSHSGGRSLYADSEGSTLEFVQVGPPWARIDIPNKVSLRVSELPMRTTAWAVENGILDGPGGEQMTLHQWVSLPDLGIPEGLGELPLPGPSSSTHEFL